MVSGLALSNETGVAFDYDGGRLFDLPLADVTEGFPTDRRLLCCLRGCPPAGPVFLKLFNEGRADFSGLDDVS